MKKFIGKKRKFNREGEEMEGDEWGREKRGRGDKRRQRREKGKRK